MVAICNNFRKLNSLVMHYSSSGFFSFFGNFSQLIVEEDVNAPLRPKIWFMCYTCIHISKLLTELNAGGSYPEQYNNILY